MPGRVGVVPGRGRRSLQLCCSTGVCGPAVDPVLPRFAADLAWLKSRGVTVSRYNLSQQPGVFVANETVKASIAGEGVGCLPLVLVDGRVVLVDGRVVSQRTYPTRDQHRVREAEAPRRSPVRGGKVVEHHPSVSRP